MKKTKMISKNPLYFNIVKPELIGEYSKGIHPLFRKYYKGRSIFKKLIKIKDKINETK